MPLPRRKATAQAPSGEMDIWPGLCLQPILVIRIAISCSVVLTKTHAQRHTRKVSTYQDVDVEVNIVLTVRII